MAINQRSFTGQAHLFALIASYAYLDEAEATEKFTELGFSSQIIKFETNQAYFLVSDTDLVLAFRGTVATEWKNLAEDLEANPVPSSTGIGKVHYGFKHATDLVWDQIKSVCHFYTKTHTIWITGHSLGGAMATLAAYKLQRDPAMPNPQALYTFGSPRVGNKTYIKAMEDSGLLHFRFVNNCDIVPRVPLWPYKHFGGMYYMNHWGNVRGFTKWQLSKDILRGLWKGIKNKKLSLIDNHFMVNYIANLENWKNGVENPQDKI
jgi:triacylglycerol lipase